MTKELKKITWKPSLSGDMWGIDQFGNAASVSHFGSKLQAEASLNSLIDCTDCENCTDCVNCHDCIQCVLCVNCVDCEKCFECKDCVGLELGKNHKDCSKDNQPAKLKLEPTIQQSALQSQVGGDHYKKLGAYQPIEVLKRWLTPEEFRGYIKGSAISYLAREQDKGKDQDITKAKHFIQLWEELK